MKAGEFVAEPDRAGGQFFGPVLEQRLEPDLRQVELPPRACCAPVLIGAAGCAARRADGSPACALAGPPVSVARRHRVPLAPMAR
jgi:hypothetical protein